MNAYNGSPLRAFAVAVLFAIGIATTIATGGSGGRLAPPPSPPPAMIAITSDNAQDVSSALIIAIGLSIDIGDISGGGVNARAVAVAPPLLKLMQADDLVSKPLARTSAKAEDCPNGGTRDITAVLADPNTLTVGDRITAVFLDCDDGDGYVISGTVDLTVSALEGDYTTDVFLLGLDVLMTDVDITEGADTVTVQGDFTLTLDSLDFPVIAQTIAGPELSLSSGPEIATFTSFDHFIQVDLAMNPEAVVVTVDGRFDSLLLGGAIDYETIVPIQANGDEDPYTGEILVTGANNSSVRIVINDSTSVTLEVDDNGDGVVDDFIDTTFATLNGRTSTINSSTAPLIAREAVRLANGFGSLAVAPDGMFVAEAPLGQIRQQAVSGDFGPLDVNCLAGGTASVSGSVATAGTFSFGDILNVTFGDCARGGEMVNGELEFFIRSYDQAPGDAYSVVSDVVETGFERTFAGAVFTGSGALETSHDYRFTSQGIVLANAWSASFNVAFDGLDQVVSPISVSAEIILGPPPVTVSRFSTGIFAAPGLGGEFVYQSLTADTLVLDSDPATGPSSGELRVTASDGSNVTVTAVDELNALLVVDEDGNGFTDLEINTTWAALQ